MPERGNIFKETLITSPKRSWFDLSFDNTLTCNVGDLVPTICSELLPSDVIHQRSSSFLRFMPMVSPVMGKCNLFSYHFIVRNRDIWTQWDKFITNADQKKTWQQNRNFVPPAMPYLDIKNIFNKFYCEEIVPPYTAIYDHPSLGGLRNVYYLVCGVYKDGQNFSFISRQRPFFNSDVDCNKVFAFVPNREDLFDGKDWNGYGVRVSGVYDITASSGYYNPFGVGSLLEFLGCNIGGFYKLIKDQLLGDDGLFDTIYATFSAEKRFPNYKPWEYTNSELSADELAELYNIDSKNIRLGYVTERFFDTHMILGVSSLSDDNGITASWYINGTLNQRGTPTTTIEWLDAPFKSDNLSLYNYQISALPLRAYRFIYDEYFRDQNYIEVNENTDFSRDGEDMNYTLSIDTLWHYLTLERKAFEHDPYTSGLPGPQKGDAVRIMPDANFKVADSVTDISGKEIYTTAATRGVDADGNFYVSGSVSTLGTGQSARQIQVDLSAGTIESLRWANAMQRYAERKSRTGGRYYEYLIGEWNSEVSDAKLNRPIYIGAEKTPIQISEVTQTSASDPQTGQPLGDLAGRGVAIGRDNRIDFTMPDYGFLFEICSVVPRTSYGQGIKPMFHRFDYMDWPLPEFAQLGEQVVPKKELYATLKREYDDSAFAYQSRFYDWKYNRDEIHSSMLTDMSHWNFARIFDDVPYMGKEFIEVHPSYRQFAVTDDSFDHVVLTMWHDININRALPEFGIPVL